MKSRLGIGLLFLFVIAFCTAGFDAGLISQTTLDLLFDNHFASIQNEIIHVTQEQGFLVNLHIEHFEKNPLESAFQSQPQRLSATQNRTELLRIYRHYILESGDLGTTLGPLTTMRPNHLNFNPHTFQYGGLFFYPMALLLKVASWTGYLHLVPDINFYIAHPLEFRKFGLLGRGWMVVMNMLCAFLLFRAASEWENETVGILSVLLFLMFPNALCVARTLKPHAAGVVWTILAFWYALRYQKSRQDTHLWISSLAAGLAGGTSMNYGLFGLLPILALATTRDQAFVRKVLIAISIMIGAFVMTNPYFFFSLDIVQKEVAYHHWMSQNGTYRLLPVLTNIFPKGLTWWMSIWLFLSAAFFAVKRRSPDRILMLAPVVYFLAFMVLGGGNRAARFTHVLSPYFAMICAFGLQEGIKRWRGAGWGLAVALLGMSFVSSVSYLSNYVADEKGQSPLFQAGRWINTLPAGTHLACDALPAVGNFPPLRFLDYDILVTPDPAYLESLPEKELPSYFISLEPQTPRPRSFQLFKTFEPIILRPRSWFGPDPKITDIAPTLYIFKHIQAKNSL